MVLIEFATRNLANVCVASGVPWVNRVLASYSLEVFVVFGSRELVPNVLPLLELSELQF